MKNLPLVQLLFLSTFLLTACDARQARIQHASSSFPETVSFESDWRKVKGSRLLKASSTDDATGATGGDGQKTDEASDDDDGSVLIADDAVTNKTALIPPEPEQPRTWPATVLVIFLVLSFALLGKTAYAKLRKRSQYQDVPTTSLIV
jgi:hypothetical protein